MSKSAMIIMLLLLVAFGSMLLAADMIVKPIEKDLALAHDLIATLDSRGWLSEDKPRPDDRVRIRTLKGAGPGRLSTRPDWGVIVEVRPSSESLTTRNRLAYMAQVILTRVEEHGRSERRLHWIEFVVRAGGKAVLRSLIEEDPRGGWLPAAPPIPSEWPPRPKKPKKPKKKPSEAKK